MLVRRGNEAAAGRKDKSLAGLRTGLRAHTATGSAQARRDARRNVSEKHCKPRLSRRGAPGAATSPGRSLLHGADNSTLSVTTGLEQHQPHWKLPGRFCRVGRTPGTRPGQTSRRGKEGGPCGSRTFPGQGEMPALPPLLRTPKGLNQALMDQREAGC